MKLSINSECREGEPIPQPKRIMIQLDIVENRYEFPEEMLLGKYDFSSYLEHCIRDSQSRGYHVISLELPEPTEDNIIKISRTIILKVGKLPEPDLSKLKGKYVNKN